MSLTPVEKKRVTELLGNTASIMSSCVARLHLASPDPNADMAKDDSVLHTFPSLSSNDWTYTNVLGALIFVIDREIDTFVFQIYDLETFELRFEYELYEDISYERLTAQFHCFEMEDCVAGFCFADPDEARKFLSKVNALKPSSKKSAPQNLLKKTNSGKGKKKGGWKRFRNWLGGGKSESNSERNFEIGEVTSVVHESHVGINADGSLDLQNIPSEWKVMFRRAGIRKKDLKDAATAKAVLNVIAETAVMQNPSAPVGDPTYEAMAAYARQMEEEKAAAEAQAQYERELEEYHRQLAEWEAEQARIAAAEEDMQSFDEADIPPPPPSDSQEEHAADAPPLPAMPHRDSRANMLRAAKRASQRSTVSSSSKQSQPAPAPPVKPKKPQSAAAAAAGGADFLKQGLLQVRLKAASVVNDRSTADVTGTRGRSKSREFLNFIKGGKQTLKKVDVKALPSLDKMNQRDKNSMMAKLQSVMKQRRAVMEESDDEEEDDDDGWSDDD